MEPTNSIIIEHPCAYCGKEIPDWRGNKKFCDDTCKYQKHNKKRQPIAPEMKHINSILAGNYEILKSLIGEQTTVTVHYTDLKKAGLNFDFHTQVKGDYFNCYGLSWRKNYEGKYVISRVPKSTYMGGKS